jgi:hypothetical protein
MRRRLTFLLLALPLAAQAPAPVTPEESGPSILALPIRVDLAPLLRQLETKIPLSPPRTDVWAEVKGKPRTYFRYNLVREPLRVTVEDDQVTVRVLTHYGVDVGVRTFGEQITVMGSCGRRSEGPREAQFELKTAFDIKPDWGVELHQTAYDVRPLNPCQITFIDYDITGIVTNVMKNKIAGVSTLLANMVRRNALIRQKADQAWSLLSQPMQIQKDLYLTFQPRRFRLAPVKTEGQILLLRPEVEVQPRLILGARPKAVPTPLPELKPNTHTGHGFRIRIDADLSYAHASHQLTAAMVGRTIATDKGKLKITSARMWGEEGQAFLEVGLMGQKGRVDGKVTLSGCPRIDTEANTLLIDDLDFTLDSKNWLAHVGDWIYHSDLKKVLAEKCVFPLDERLKGVRKSVQASLNRKLSPTVQLSGRLTDLRMGPISTGAKGFSMWASLEGALGLDVK